MVTIALLCLVPLPVLSVEDRVAAAMSAPLKEVLGAGQAVRPPEDVVRRWDLPESDRRALLRWGLPLDNQMRPLFQAGSDPALVPNLAGERERQAASPGERLYTLAHWGPEEFQLRIGAVAGTGRVLKIQPNPTTADDLPVALRVAYAGLYQPSVEFFSSSVAQFVETSWRCHVAKEIAYELWQDQPAYDGPQEEHEAWFRRLHECERIMLAHIERIDGHVRADDTGTLWATVVTELTHAGN
jgi:SUKH-4 immunity protein of toxin-antitoxin system